MDILEHRHHHNASCLHLYCVLSKVLTPNQKLVCVFSFVFYVVYLFSFFSLFYELFLILFIPTLFTRYVCLTCNFSIIKVMPSCYVKSCRSTTYKDGGELTFHIIPKNYYNDWMTAIGGTMDLSKTKRTYICSLHFLEKDFDRTGQTVRLREGVIPTLNLEKENKECVPQADIVTHRPYTEEDKKYVKHQRKYE